MAEPPGGSTEPEIAKLVRRAGQILAERGYEVVEATPPAYEQSLDIWRRWLSGELRVQLPLLRQVMGPDALRFVDLVDATVPDIDIAGHVGTLIERRAIARAWSAFLHQHALVLSPVWTRAGLRPRLRHRGRGAGPRHTRAHPPGAARQSARAAGRRRARRRRRAPAAVQVLGGPFRELACLEAARAIEDAVSVRTPIDPRL